MNPTKLILDGNEATAYIAYKTNEVCAIYPITPSSPMGEWADLWASQGKTNIWGTIPKVIEMQSEAGAAGTLHGALQGGTLATTFTASQGLLLMIPNMYKIAGELLPSVIHISARTVATHALSIFGDHSDAMAVRSTGFSMLFSGSVQEAMDMALIAQATTLKSRVPILHAFDGFRTSHEINKIDGIPDEVIMKMLDDDCILQHRQRAMAPDNPVLKGSAQNPDVFFQGREAANRYYMAVPEIVSGKMKLFSELTGRHYRLFDYSGHPEAERIIVIMGSGAGAVHETVNFLVKKGEKVGFINVRLYRPFSVNDFIAAVPSTVRKISVLDRCKDSAAIGEPLYQDVVTAFAENRRQGTGDRAQGTEDRVQGGEMQKIPLVFGGRYGLSSKEFTPAMVKTVFDELGKSSPKNHFTVGINDDVTMTSLLYDRNFHIPDNNFKGVFFGLGSDGTVSANKNSIKIIGETTDNYVQGYFVYDSKKAGAVTISHLRFGEEPIRSTYLIDSADFVACHQFTFMTKFDILEKAKDGAVFLLNSPYGHEEVWDNLPRSVQQQIIEKKLKFYVINATGLARELDLGARINTLLQTCFFAISGILPKEEAIKKIKKAIEKSYSHRGEETVRKNFEAVDNALSNLHEVKYPVQATSAFDKPPAVSEMAPDYMKNVLAKILNGEGDLLPVSVFTPDGSFPTATSQWEKRNIADIIPEWDEKLCTQCNKCIIICPHAAIRAKVYDKNFLVSAPPAFKSVQPIGKEFNKENEVYTLQVAVEDCTGCSLCVEYCPVASKTDPKHKAINMIRQLPVREVEKTNWDFFLEIPEIDHNRFAMAGVKSTQFFCPMFEFSGACAGCGETPYVKLISQLYGDQMLVANATGCSSIYGGNLPTTPWTVNHEGRGPSWANSLFEDNAEFGLGLRLAVNKKRDKALELLTKLKNEIGEELAQQLINAQNPSQNGKSDISALIAKLQERLKFIIKPEAKLLAVIADNLTRKSVWIMGGDGWAYDIGYGGLDHLFSTGEDVNILVMDTEVYSNTGGQTSKATPVGASAKFSIAGKQSSKKDLALQAITYGNVYVAQIAMGASDTQTVRAITEANSYQGTSLIIAYSHCIEHGYDMKYGAQQQKKAVESGHWPLFRYNPMNPPGKRFILDSKEPTLPLRDYIYNEARYSRLIGQNGKRAEELLAIAEEDVKNRWIRIRALAGM